MIAAGFGMSSRVEPETLVALFAQVLAEAGLEAEAVSCAATVSVRQGLPAFQAAMARLHLPVRAVTAAEMEAAGDRVATSSPPILARHGVGSLAEAAALAAAGDGARLLVPRRALRAATCALAIREGHL
ncbi:cobalamin biosynthesis protein [Xanthobacter sediminis]